MSAYTVKHGSVLETPRKGDKIDGHVHPVALPNGEMVDNPELFRVLQMGNAQAAEYVASLNRENMPEEHLPKPLPSKLGTPEWYQQRYIDFVRRHPGEGGASYYINYGMKYCLRFSKEVYPELSAEGQNWLVHARTNLQAALENELLDDPEGYDEVELDDGAFTDLAYSTHEQAYIDAGLASLPVSDLATIAGTPDFCDLFSSAGLSQVVRTARESVGPYFEAMREDGPMEHLLGDPEYSPVPYHKEPETTGESPQEHEESERSTVSSADASPDRSAGAMNAFEWLQGSSGRKGSTTAEVTPFNVELPFELPFVLPSLGTKRESPVPELPMRGIRRDLESRL